MDSQKIEFSDVSEIPHGQATVVVSVPEHLKHDQIEQVRAIAEAAFPGRRLMIAHGGIQVSEFGRSEQMDRIEAKLDALLEALAEEGDGEEPQHDLDGNLIEGGERDETASLG